MKKEMGLCALFCLLFLCSVSGKVVDFSEVSQLLELKNAISDPYDMLSSWKSTDLNHCSWFGVTCNSRGMVSELRIPGGNFADLSFCLSNRRFGLERNCSSAKKGKFLRGKLSNVIGEFLELRVLSLPFNQIIGELPNEIWGLKSLEVIDIEGNLITGNLSIIDFSNLKKLQVLNLGFNRLFGKIPKSLEECKDLSVLNLARNRIQGPVPVFIGNIMNLKGVYLSSKNFPDPITVDRDGLPTLPPQPRRVLNDSGKKKGFSALELVLILAASLIVLILLALIVVYFYMRNRKRSSRVDGVNSIPSPPRTGNERLVVFRQVGAPLTFDSVIQATGNFTSRYCIGSGGFGSTYRAEISPGITVAVKRLTVEMCQGVPQFNAEIRTLGRIRHPNLITLIGYYSSPSEMFLVYNYLPGGSLEDFIREKRNRSIGLKVIHQIAIEVAGALAFLHDDCNPRILHRDVKPSNILLDTDLKPYLSDFGLSRLLEGFETHVTTGVAGTFGYVAPEYALSCRVSDKADVYSYGVMLLELISDKRALDPSFSTQRNGFTIVTWAVMLRREGRMKEVFADGMWEAGPETVLLDLLQLGLVCTAESASLRPTMRQVVRKLRHIQRDFDR
ncbi:hypothetical protein L1887_15529 [Cichorium endivia]|nr:hypothetical protein L1887_15529 [Cichorium endivia]